MELIMFTWIVGGVLIVSIGLILPAWPSRNYPVINFEEFKKLYSMNPDRWRLYGYSVTFIKSRDVTRHTQSTDFQFGVVDYYRYKHWKSKTEKQKKKEQQCKALEEVISILKSDSDPVKRMDELCIEIDNRDALDAVRDYFKKSGYPVVEKSEKEFPG